VLPDAESEQEVDFARYGRTIAARWWLVAAAVAAGVVLGYLVSLGGGNVFRAEATIYLGQPLSLGGAQIQGVNTNPTTVAKIVKSQSVVRDVAARVGVRPDRLQRGISTNPVAGSVARLGQSPLVEISVRGPWRAESAAAANLLAQTVVDGVSGYVDTKISSLEELLEGQNRELEAIDARVERNQAALDAEELSLGETLTLINIIGQLELRRGQLLADRVETRQQLSLARDVERGRIVTEASPEEVAARSARNAMLVGGFIGLIAGALVALAWGWRRRAPQR
jgi:uncharacterized protein involved in exopolysaccharide biosynthesis